MYQSKAAAKRRAKHARRVRTRNTIIFWAGIVVGGIIGSLIALAIIKVCMPDHPMFNHPIFQ